MRRNKPTAPSMPPQAISGFSSSPSVSTKPHSRRDEPAPDGSTESVCRRHPRQAMDLAQPDTRRLGWVGPAAAPPGLEGHPFAVCPHAASHFVGGKRALRRLISERRRPRCACHWPLSAARPGQQEVACTGWHPSLGGVGRDDTGARGLRWSAMRIPPRRIPTGLSGPTTRASPWVESYSFLDGPFVSGIEEVVAFMCTYDQRRGRSCCGQARVPSDGS
jgi:hypothetical protein